MGEFSRSGPQMPTEQRRLAQKEHEQELRDAAGLKHHRGDDEPEAKKAPWWKFWERSS
jgi:hypothetical protein